MKDLDIIEVLGQELDTKQPEYEKLASYFECRQPLAYLPDEVRRSVGNRLQPVHINWPRIVVNSVEERLDVERFRLGDAKEFTDAWDLWQANNLDEESQLAHADAILYGISYVSVWRGDKYPSIVVESPRQVHHMYDPATREVTAAIKRWFDPVLKRGFINVYTADHISKYVSKEQQDEYIDISNLPANAWTLRDNGTLSNPLGRVPLIPLVNRRRIMHQHGDSELTDILPVADAINKLATDMMISAEFHAMPRRYATGVEVVEDEAGEPQEAFSVLKGRTWIAENDAAKIGSLPEADLSNFINAIEMFNQHLTMLGAVPPHYQNAAKGSLAGADSIRASEANLVAKARRKMRSFGGAWEEAIRLALQIRDGELDENMEKLEIVWRDPENRTQAQIVDAAAKRMAIGVPEEQLWEDIGYTEAQIARMKKMRKEQEDARQQEGTGEGDQETKRTQGNGPAIAA